MFKYLDKIESVEVIESKKPWVVVGAVILGSIAGAFAWQGNYYAAIPTAFIAWQSYVLYRRELLAARLQRRVNVFVRSVKEAQRKLGGVNVRP